MTTRPEGVPSRVRLVGRSLERHPWLAYLALTALAHPILEIILFGERALQTAHDVFDDDVPRLFSIPADWQRFGPSLWDPHLTSGNALLAQFALPPLAPDVLLSFILPPFVAYSINAALMVFLAGLAMHLFLRDSLRLPAVACFAGGILAAFAVWGYILGYAALLLPLVLLWTERAVASDRRPRDVVALALLVAFIAFSSQVQILALVALVTLTWVVATSEALREASAGATRFALAWLLGALLAAPVLLTQLVAIGESQRTVWRLDPVGNLLGAWLGQLASIPFGIEVAGVGGDIPNYGSWFPGVVGLPLLVLSLVIPRRNRREKAALGLLAALLLVDLVAMTIIPLQDGLPLFGSFQFVRVLHLVPPLIVINIALAIGWLTRSDIRAELIRGRAFVLAGLLALAGVALAAQAGVIARPILRWLRDGAPLVDLGTERLAWILAGLAFTAGGIALAAAFVLALRRPRVGVPRGVLAAAVVACLLAGLAVERASFTRSALLHHAGMGTWAESVPPTAAQELIAAQPGGGRVLSVIGHANRSLSAGLDAADGYQTIYPVRYHALFGALIRPQLEASRGLTAYFDEWGNRAYAFSPDIRKPIADLLGIRWLYVAPESAIDPALKARYANQVPVDPAFEHRFEAEGVNVYENPDAFPRAFIVHDVSTHADRDAAVAAISAATSEQLRGQAHLEASDLAQIPLPAVPPRGPDGSAVADPVDSATLVLDTPDRVQVATHSERPGVLVLADTYARGWVAEIDGEETQLFPVDVALRGVALPAGDHVVTFIYRPIETLVGFWLALVTALALLAWLALPRLRRRSSARGSTPAA